MAEAQNIKVLIVCSGPGMSSYPKDKEKVLPFIKSYFGVSEIDEDYLTGMEEQENFPEDINQNVTYDAIWFAGCNVLSWIFTNQTKVREAFENRLKRNGIIMFTEGSKYIEKFSDKEHKQYTPYMTIENYPLLANPSEESLEQSKQIIRDLFEKNINKDHDTIFYKKTNKVSVTTSALSINNMKNQQNQEMDDLERRLQKLRMDDMDDMDDLERRFQKLKEIGGKKKTKKIKKVRKHQGINQTGGNAGRLRKGYRYSGKKLKSGLPQIIKCKSKKC